MKMACIIIALATALPLFAQKPVAQPITDLLKPKWKAHIGQTSYRTNIMHYGDKIIVGSNGHSYKDYALDSDNGVYILQANTGKQVYHLAHENLGDMDVNGVAVDGNRLYFGSDNDEMHCYLLTGEKIWTVPVSGDVEVLPVLLDVNKDGIKDVVFTTESGEVGALDAIDGAQLWSFKIASFTGWKKTQNRIVFKLGDWFRNGNGFMVPPQLADLNNDGNMDIIATARDGYIYALDGATGKQYWRAAHAGYLTIAPIIYTARGETRICFFTDGVKEDDWRSRLKCVDRYGNVFQSQPVPSAHQGFQTTVLNNQIVFAGWDSVYTVNIYSGALRKGHLPAAKNQYYGNPITATPMLLDLLGLGSPQLILIGQNGKITLMDWNGLVRLRELEMPSGSETPPLLTDVDCDGKLDLLVSTYDGYLYCYATPFTEKALAWATR